MWDGVDKSKALALIETHIELVAVQHVEGAVVVERGVRDDKVLAGAGCNRLPDARPSGAEIVRFTDEEIPVAPLNAGNGGFRPIELPIRSPRAVTACFVISEVLIRNPGVAR